MNINTYLATEEAGANASFNKRDLFKLELNKHDSANDESGRQVGLEFMDSSESEIDEQSSLRNQSLY